MEAEFPFLTFDELVCDVVGRVLKPPVARLVYDLNPDFKTRKLPFKQMNYSAAIVWLKEHNIKKGDGTSINSERISQKLLRDFDRHH